MPWWGWVIAVVAWLIPTAWWVVGAVRYLRLALATKRRLREGYWGPDSPPGSRHP
jgi:hypothetical protein